jgi:hypothetical protein
VLTWPNVQVSELLGLRFNMGFGKALLGKNKKPKPLVTDEVVETGKVPEGFEIVVTRAAHGSIRCYEYGCKSQFIYTASVKALTQEAINSVVTPKGTDGSSSINYGTGKTFIPGNCIWNISTYGSYNYYHDEKTLVRACITKIEKAQSEVVGLANPVTVYK